MRYSEPRLLIGLVREIRVRRRVRVRIWGQAQATGGDRLEWTALCGSAEPYRCVLQHCSTVNRRPVPHNVCQPASLQTPDAARASMCRSQPCSVVVEIFFGVREPRGSCIRPSHAVVEYHGSRWKSSSVAVAEQKANPSSREGTDSGQPRQVKGPHGRGPWIFAFTRGHLAPVGPTPKRESTAETCLGARGPGPQVASPCLMHQQQVIVNRAYRDFLIC